MPEEIPNAGRDIVISERSLRVLYEAAQKADEAMLIGSCQGKNLVYCAECWAMSDAQHLLLPPDGDIEEVGECVRCRVHAELLREILEAMCAKHGISIESQYDDEDSARNYELIFRLGIGHVIGMGTGETTDE